MARFIDLPDEILAEILHEIDSLRDFYSLSQQCRRFYRLVNMKDRQRFHRIRLTGDTSFQEALSLLLEILRTPSIGCRYVRQLEYRTFCSSTEYPDEVPGPAAQIMSEDIELIEGAIRTAGYTDPQKSGRMLNWVIKDPAYYDFGSIMYNRALAEFLGAVTVLLLSVLPDIRFLAIDLATSNIKEYLERMNAIDSPVKRLQQLRAVHITPPNLPPNTTKAIDVKHTLELFHKLPLITTAKINGLYLQWSPSEAHIRSVSDISRLCIVDCDMSSYMISRLILHPKILTEFKYCAGGKAPWFSRTVGPRLLGFALRKHEMVLRCLHLDLDAIVYVESPDIALYQDPSDSTTEIDGNDPRNFTLASWLRGFLALTHLSIGIKLLLGDHDLQTPRLVDMLPPNLRFLRIYGYIAGNNGYHTSQISQLMEEKDAKLPQLEEVLGVTEHIPSAEHVDCGDDDYY